MDKIFILDFLNYSKELVESGNINDIVWVVFENNDLWYNHILSCNDEVCCIKEILQVAEAFRVQINSNSELYSLFVSNDFYDVSKSSYVAFVEMIVKIALLKKL